MAAFILLRYVWGLWGLPWYQMQHRSGDYPAVAQQILKRTQGYPLYVRDSTSTGMSVVAELDILRLPRAPLARPPAHWDNGFVIEERPGRKSGRLLQTYPLPERDIYLLCRGAACGSMGNQATEARP